MSPLFGRTRGASSATVIPELDEGSLRTSSGSANVPGNAIVFQAAALLLAYPEADLIENLDVIETALAGSATAELFAPVLTHLRSQPLRESQSFHVQEFDLSRRHALHLSYWTDGDTRRRGEVLAEIKGVFRDSGLLGDLHGELPDYLPIMLEFAVADPD
ncbi:MAG TPA: nitrate reductase molybdenum cofactor assembly chaperone, partial [Propionicimonas sp.]